MASPRYHGEGCVGWRYWLGCRVEGSTDCWPVGMRLYTRLDMLLGCVLCPPEMQMSKNVNKHIFMLRSLKHFGSINLSWSLCTGLHLTPAQILLMLFGIQVSLPIRPTSLKEFKKGLWELFLGLIMFHMLMLWMCVMLIVYQPRGSNIVSSLRNPLSNVTPD